MIAVHKGETLHSLLLIHHFLRDSDFKLDLLAGKMETKMLLPHFLEAANAQTCPVLLSVKLNVNLSLLLWVNPVLPIAVDYRRPLQEPPLQPSSTRLQTSFCCTSRVTSVWWQQASTSSTRVSLSLTFWSSKEFVWIRNMTAVGDIFSLDRKDSYQMSPITRLNFGFYCNVKTTASVRL